MYISFPKKRLKYWLDFLRSGQRKLVDNKLKVLIVATHFDDFKESFEGKMPYIFLLLYIIIILTVLIYTFYITS